MAERVLPTPPPRRKASVDKVTEATPPLPKRKVSADQLDTRASSKRLPKLDVAAASTPKLGRGDPEAAGPSGSQDTWTINMPQLLSSMDKTKVASYLQNRMKDVKDTAFQTAKSSLSFGERFTLAFLDKMKRWSRRGFTHIFLFVVLIGYNALGACIMWILERPNVEHKDLAALKGDVVQRLLEYAANNSMDVQNTTAFEVTAHEELDQLLVVAEEQINLRRWYPDPDDNPWGFWGSMFFCFTIHSTIGYGHLAPPDTAGRAVTIIYALLGIPIFLIVLADYGKLFTRGLKYMLAAVYRLYHTKSCTWVRRTAPVENVVKGIKTVYEKTGLGSDEEDAGDQEGEAVISIDDEFNLPISLALFILLAYLLAGAILFALLEDWTYFDSFYFVFISMTTIGFGDMVPQSAGVMMCTTLYMIFGLALTSMCINVIQEKMTQHFKQASIKLGTRFGVSVPVTPAPVVVEVAPVHGKDN